jgi:pimeloyl-ACP methyl ester carboxylesterase
MRTVDHEIEFLAAGVTCRGMFVRPAGTRAAPLVVLAHGLGGVYEMRLDAYARKFAEAGYAALTFDYRYFGRSDGTPRHLLARKLQQADIAAAIAFGKTLDGVDAERVVLWGTSLAGGHMIDVSSGRSDIAATIVQAPFTDGLASMLATHPLSSLGVALFVIADMCSRLVGLGPVFVPLAAPAGLPALMTNGPVVESVLALVPEGSRLSGKLSALYRTYAARSVKLGSRVSPSELAEPASMSRFIGSVIFPSGTALVNGVSANFGLEILFWRPGKKLETLRSPILVCACERDEVAPVKPTIAYAKSAPKGELKVYPRGHFDIYVGAPFEQVSNDQLDFLKRVVPVAG